MANRTAKASLATSSGAGRVFREITLTEPIRYAAGDHVESWLHELLCLDATNNVPKLSAGLPHPSQCDLYYVNRDTLFSRHRVSEAFLQKMVALYVSSHYKNSPNDLQLMSDAPAHHLFVLLAPQSDPQSSSLPDILCVIQLCFEGEISKQSILASLAKGQRGSGDLIPWTMSQQYQDSDFAKLSGGRIVRIACHPDLPRMGYGTRALEQLAAYFQGDIPTLSLDENEPTAANGSASPLTAENGADTSESQPAGTESSLLTEKIAPRKKLPPLLVRLNERAPERLHYLGTSFGSTLPLYNFWKKGGYVPVYLRLTTNDLTGEHTCIMLKALKSDDMETAVDRNWLSAFANDFKRRFLSLLSYEFRSFLPALALSVLNPRLSFGDSATPTSDMTTDDNEAPSNTISSPDSNWLSIDELRRQFSPYDLRRLESYSRNLLDYHVIVDLLPTLGNLYFQQRIPVGFAYSQAAILLCCALQHKSVDQVTEELNLPSSQVLALFNKAMRKLSKFFKTVEERAAEATMPSSNPSDLRMNPLSQGLNEELNSATNETSRPPQLTDEQREKRDKLLLGISVSQYAVGGDDKEWQDALKGRSSLSQVTVKSNKPEEATGQKRKFSDQDKKLKKHDNRNRTSHGSHGRKSKRPST